MGILSRDFKVGNSRNKTVIHIIGNEVENGSLALVETAVPSSVQSIDSIVIIQRTAPTPVEIELTVTLTIAAAGKGMATTVITSGIIHRETFFKTGNQHFFPFIFGIKIAVFTGSLVSITEIIGNRRRNILRIGTRRTATIHHINRHAAMVHQGSNSLVIGIVAGVRHVGPIIGRGTEIDSLHRITLRGIAVLAIALCRPVPVLHHHRHGRSHTTSIGMTARASMAGGAIGIVRIVLVPQGGQQRSDITTSATVVILETILCHMCPFRGDFHFGFKVILLSVSNLTRIETQVVGKTVGHVVRVDALLIGKRKDRTCYIIS